jgi:L-fuconate dehydratase
MTRITSVEALDIRFPTSEAGHGSDAMHPDPDYSTAYAIVRTDADDGLEGHGFSFTCGRGTEIVVRAIESLTPLVVDARLSDITRDLGGFWRRLVGDSQLRWIGPEKGAIHLATAAIVNAVWDLLAKRAGVPLWQYLAEMPPERIVQAVDFRHITDALTPDEALTILRRGKDGQDERLDHLAADGYPAYVTSVGWLGYGDDEIRRRCREALAEGWTQFKMKVGADRDDDRRRAAIIRSEIGDRPLMVDANQVWEVDEAIDHMKALAEFSPRWIEEPVHPDDVLGHAAVARGVAPIPVATGEHASNRVMFKQLLQADAVHYVQLDACRLGGVNEVLAVLLLAAAFDRPVCPHAGGVGLCELVQHISVFDHLGVSTSLDDRVTEFADHLHEHFVDPVRTRDGRYELPRAPGYSAEMTPEARTAYAFPSGRVWAEGRA